MKMQILIKVQNGSLKYFINLVKPVVFRFLAMLTIAQPDPHTFFSFDLNFTLLPEMEAQFEYGNIDAKDLRSDFDKVGILVFVWR